MGWYVWLDHCGQKSIKNFERNFFLVNISYFVLRKYVYTHMKITLFTYRQSVKINMKFSKTQVQYTLHVFIGTLIFVMCNGNQNVVTSFEICRLEIGR